MTILYVNTGSGPNQGDGDTLLTAFGKINFNFALVEGLLNNSSATITINSFPPLDPVIGSIWFDTVSGRTFVYYDDFWVDSNPPAINPIPWNTVTTDIIPGQNLTFNLGSNINNWKTLFVGTVTTNFITLNGTNTAITIQTTGTNSWKFDNTNKLKSTQVGYNDGYLKFVGAAPANQLELVTDTALYAGDRYVVIDPGSGTDIHIRAGGEMDNGFASIILGGEKSQFKVGNDGNVYIGTHLDQLDPLPDLQAYWKFDPYGSIVLPTLLDQSSGHLYTATSIILNSNSKQWKFTSTGVLITPGDIIPDTNLAYDLGSTSSQWRSLYVGTSTIYLGGTALSVSGGTITVDGNPVSGGGGASLGDRLTSSTFSVILEGTTGTVSVPNSIISQGYQLNLAGSQYSYGVGRYLRVRDGDYESHLHLDTPDNSLYDIILGDDSKFVRVDHTGPVVIGTDGVSSHSWIFGTDGSLTLPSGNITIGNFFGNDAILCNTGTAFGILSQGAGSSVLQWLDDVNAPSVVAGIAANSLYSNTGSVQIFTGVIGSPPQHTWTFNNNGELALPGNIHSINSIGLVAGDAVSITSNNTVDPKIWTFDETGTVAFPNSGTIGPEGMGGFGISNGTSGNPVHIVNKNVTGNYLADIILTAGDGISGEISFNIWNTQTASVKTLGLDSFANLSVPGVIYNNETSNVGQLLLAGDAGEAATYLALPSDVGSTSMNVRLANSNGGIQLYAGNNSWLFNNTGELALPNGSKLYESSFIAASGTNAVLSQFDSNTQIYTMDYAVGVQTHNSGTFYTWLFNNDGEVVFPDGSIQTTAYTGTNASTTASTVDITNTNGLGTTYYLTFVENRTAGQEVRADVDLTYQTADNILGTGQIRVNSSTSATSTNSGALQVTGGVGIGGNLYVGNTIYQNGEAVGYIGMPQNNQTSNYTVAISDQGKHIYCTGTSFTVTIPANTVTSFPIGSSVAFIAGPTTTATIAIQTDTMYLGGSTGTSGTRTLSPFGMATAVKVAETTWFISGAGLA